MRTVQDTIAKLPPGKGSELCRPDYRPSDRTEKLVLGVSSMKDHMTDEGWQITHGLSLNGYRHCGFGLDEPETNVRRLLQKYSPDTLVIQDIREWDVKRGDFRQVEARFIDVAAMAADPEVFRLTILKDSHQQPYYHRQAAEDMGCHAWIVYYNPRIVKHLAPYVRTEHLVRTTHSIDSELIPAFVENRPKGCLFSGAVSDCYPLRKRMRNARAQLPMDVLNHPGYHRNGSVVPQFLQTLSQYKVAICTSSTFGYSLRKLIEATCCGCRIITDLPVDEVLPVVEENLVRIPTDLPIPYIARAIKEAEAGYDFEKQRDMAERAAAFYDYREVTRRLAEDISELKRRY